MAAEGDDTAVRIQFLKQTITVEGSALSALLRDLSAQRVSMIAEPHRTDKFYSVPGPRISALTVTPGNHR